MNTDNLSAVLHGVNDIRLEQREIPTPADHQLLISYPTALNLVASRKIDLTGLTRAHYSLEDTLDAFKRAQKADVIKVFINCDNSR
ncbi:hypothetical protein TELCIR_17827 [Teladorsagia circumcincta]|uniref:Alcohol dehydrogenase-like C-terminal domain-containing protein n=1 Tax=Teladorsagia circumcincta TaxID=45464 RepID=A0A2G9TRQ3_TELCI|nr:hypothetical protein TELCIR_17827 [Teladorsagia circumcincta]